MRKRLIRVFLIGLFVASGMAGNLFAADPPGVTRDKIIIGNISPLTGPIAMVGTSIANGAKDYFNYVNEQGGIHGRKIEFIAEDDKYEPATAIASLKKLVTRDNIFALSSTSGTPITAALAPTIDKEGVPSMCTIAAGIIFQPKPPKNIFSFGAFYSENMVYNIEYMLFTLKAKDPKVAFFYQDDDFGQEGHVGFKAAVEKYKLNVVAVEKHTRGALDISSQVFNIKKANPDYLFVSIVPSHSIMLLKEAKKVGLAIPIIAVANTRFEQIIEVSGDAAENFYCSEYTALPNEANIPGMAKLMALWHKQNPPDKVPARYYIISQVNAMIMAEAMKRCGKDLTRDKFRQTLESFKDFDPEGITEKITYSSSDHCPLTAMRMVKANPKTNRYEAISGWGMTKFELRKK